MLKPAMARSLGIEMFPEEAGSHGGHHIPLTLVGQNQNITVSCPKAEHWISTDVQGTIELQGYWTHFRLPPLPPIPTEHM
ncbi:MAG: hypothetical protein WCC17_10090 [Candidatus Nitrosopolaris sp.]